MYPVHIALCIISITRIVWARSDCYSFWTRWTSCPPMTHFPHSTSTCFKSVDNTFVFLNYEVDTSANILCDNKPVDIELFDCLAINHLHNVTFDNCLFSTPSVGDVLKDTNPKVIYLYYNQSQRVNHDLLFHQLPETEMIIIVGARSFWQINISFVDIPSLKKISLLETDYSFSMSQLRMLPSLQDFAACRGSRNDIPLWFFNDSTSLIHVNLGENCLSDLPSGVFTSLNTVYTIRLHRNCFTFIKSEWFSGLSSLLYLDFSYNKLTSIPNDLLPLIKNIEIFNISSNLQMVLSEDILCEANNLIEFRADNCSLTSIPPNFLKNVSLLSTFSVSKNNLTHLPSDLFSNHKVLKNIFLQNNRLTAIPKGFFSNLDALRTLLIHSNEIGSIDYDAFTGLKDLVELDLHSNKLQILNSSVFADLTKLQILDLSRNRLKILQRVHPFGSSRYLELVNVSRNSLSEFPSVDWNLHGVLTVDCDHNDMTIVHLNPLGKDGTKVTLRNNPIVTIKITGEYASEKKLVRFLLTAQTLVCDCDLQGFLNFIGDSVGRLAFPNATEIKCSEPKEWKNVPVTDLVPVHVVCPLNSDCPTSCSCFVLKTGSVLTDCSNATIARPPTLIPSGTSVLHLENNIISSLANIESWVNVTDLYLSNNSLSSLSNWTIPSNLQLLAIDGNSLVDLPLTLMEMVDSSPEFRIYLADNDWLCDCRSVPIKTWFTRNAHKIADYNHTVCTRDTMKPKGKIKSLIRDTPLDLFCPVHQPIASGQISTIVLSVVFIALLLIGSFIIHYRYNNTIMAFLYSHNLYCRCCEPEDVDEDKTFDAFVCYSTVDREIAMTMMRELEPFHRLCIHERDWLPGYPISHHIVNSVQSSRKTLLLVSKDFLDSIWFRVEFRTAYNQMMEDKMHRLVLVLVGELGDVSHLETDLRHLMSTKTYLQWGEKWFWEKLRYALRPGGSKHASDIPMNEKRSSCNVEGFVFQSNTISDVSLKTPSNAV